MMNNKTAALPYNVAAVKISLKILGVFPSKNAINPHRGISHLM